MPNGQTPGSWMQQAKDAPLFSGRVVSSVLHTNNPSRPEYYRPGGAGYKAPVPKVGGTGAGAGAAAGVGGGLDPVKQLQQMQAASAAENKARLDKILGYADLYGQTQLRNITEQTAQQGAAATQNLMSRGLGNSTIVNSVQAGIQNDAQNQRAAVGEQQGMMKAGVLQGVSNPYPDLGMYASLLMKPGALTGPR
jgi:hypothetical protein